MLAFDILNIYLCRGSSHVVALFPCPSGTESETDECGPCATLEEEDGEDDTERGTEGRADEHGAQAVVPLA